MKGLKDDLAKFMTKYDYQPLRIAKFFTLARALRAINLAGYVHSQLSENNILFDESGELYLGNLSACKRINEIKDITPESNIYLFCKIMEKYLVISKVNIYELTKILEVWCNLENEL